MASKKCKTTNFSLSFVVVVSGIRPNTAQRGPIFKLIDMLNRGDIPYRIAVV